MVARPPILILAGGLGTRLKHLASNVPKPMAPVAGKPFLHWLIGHFIQQGFSRFIFSTQHRAEVIESYPWRGFFPQAAFSFVRESQPLGTGGAVLEVFKRQPQLECAWVVNGDTFLPDRLPDSDAGPCVAKYGLLPPGKIFDALPNVLVEGIHVKKVVSSHETLSFAPGAPEEPYEEPYFDAGSVFLTRAALAPGGAHGAPPREAPCSLSEVLAPSMASRRVGYFLLDGPCFDIGTPERHARFEGYVKN